MSSIQQTSVQTFYELMEEGKLGERQKRTFEGFRKYGHHTDLEMVRILHLMEPNQLRPRRNELVKVGVLEEKDRRKCEVSSRRAIVWGLVRHG